jgi:dTDP-4-dehydrorhamnose 3,5-epimerase
MKIHPTALDGVLLIEPDVFGDARGFFIETWNAARFGEAGIDAAFVQDNHSRSRRGVLRGLHYQTRRPQGKLVRVTSGRAFDVAVDIRAGRASFGAWAGFELSHKNKHMLWIPPGFAHGFLALENDTDLLYKCTDLHDPGFEGSLAWNDPDLAVAWPLGGLAPILSCKDAAAGRLCEIGAFA